MENNVVTVNGFNFFFKLDCVIIKGVNDLTDLQLWGNRGIVYVLCGISSYHTGTCFMWPSGFLLLQIWDRLHNCLIIKDYFYASWVCITIMTCSHSFLLLNMVSICGEENYWIINRGLLFRSSNLLSYWKIIRCGRCSSTTKDQK